MADLPLPATHPRPTPSLAAGVRTTCPVPATLLVHAADGRSSQASTGGGILVKPVGVIEVAQEQTRFIPIAGAGRRVAWVGALLAGMALGRLLARR